MSSPDSGPGTNGEAPWPPRPIPLTNEEIYLNALHALLWDPTPFTEAEIEDLMKNGVDFGEVIPEIVECREARRGSSAK